MRRFSATAASQFATVIGAFVVGALIGKLFGAGWGVAAGVGQVVFAATLVTVLLLSPRS